MAVRSISITADKSSLFGDEEMLITASASGFASSEAIFVKGAFYQEGGTPNYFGYTKNGENWVKNSETSVNQLQVNVGSWDGALRIKSDFSDSGYKGEGDYRLKIGFYYTTSGGSLSSVNWSSNILSVTINEPDPTPTPTPTPARTPTPSLSPTKTPIPTKSPTPKPTSNALTRGDNGSGSAVLGIKAGLSLDNLEASTSAGNKKFPIVAVVLVIAGTGLTSAALFLGIKKSKVDLPLNTE